MDFEVYTDRSQCEYFEVSYMDMEAKLVIAASTLLASKDYDQEHREYLGFFGSATIILTRTPEQGPGWWKVTEVLGWE
tara:strand:+ start:720 stop:953 length:234 start_codon:yes stop_codon:yes gene_type:complete